MGFIRPFLVFFLFYILIPCISAIIVHYNWNNFRKRFIASLSVVPSDKISDGVFIRKFGRLESIVRNSILWVNIDDNILWIDTSIIPIYSLETIDDDLLSCKNNIKQLSPAEMEGLFTGLQVYVSGEIVLKEGNYHLSGSKESLFILFSGRKEDFVPYVIAKSRYFNELWNPVTLLSLGIGMSILILYGLVVIQSNFPVAIISLALAGLPVSVFFPPAVFFYYFFRKLWLKGKKHIIKMDIDSFEMQFRNLKEEDYIKRYRLKGSLLLVSAIVVFTLGMIVQLYIIILLMVRFFNSI
ncbi:hypothetical protein WKV44_07475 [Spirochaetia bacterium 38H-sp]|uniref:Uncharacterized protein n=1 Tax=Rarispira pelagica TaxID=3141764 RepID=A0ABU9UCI1_9SPIR